MSRGTEHRRSLIAPIVGAVLALAALAFGASFVFSQEHAAAARPNHDVGAERPVAPVSVLGGRIVFRNAPAQTREFIGYYHSIKLTPAQESIKAAVLKSMSAVCCYNSTAYECCCPCNLSKSIWGLSNYAIARHHANAAQLREVVDGWLTFSNPNGFRGTACYDGRCREKPAKDGCAGMEEKGLNV